MPIIRMRLLYQPENRFPLKLAPNFPVDTASAPERQEYARKGNTNRRTEKMTDHKITMADLNQFTGTEYWYKHMIGNMTYTDGIKYLAEYSGAYWLVDIIAFSQVL